MREKEKSKRTYFPDSLEDLKRQPQVHPHLEVNEKKTQKIEEAIKNERANHQLKPFLAEVHDHYLKGNQLVKRIAIFETSDGEVMLAWEDTSGRYKRIQLSFDENFQSLHVLSGAPSLDGKHYRYHEEISLRKKPYLSWAAHLEKTLQTIIANNLAEDLPEPSPKKKPTSET